MWVSVGGSRGGVSNSSGWCGEVLRAVGERDEGWFFSSLRKEIGNGRNTRFWEGKWTGDIPLKVIFPRL